MNWETLKRQWADLNRNKLPDVSASDNDKIAKVVNGDWATGVDNNETHLLITMSESSGTYSADKTFTAIKTAISNKQEIDCRLTVSSGTYQWFNLMGSSNTEVAFYAFEVVESAPQIKIAKVTSDGWAVSTIALAIAEG